MDNFVLYAPTYYAFGDGQEKNTGSLVRQFGGSKVLLAAGLSGGVGAALLGYQMFAHVKKRVNIWINPWADSDGAGYQIVQSLIAMVNGGAWGWAWALEMPPSFRSIITILYFLSFCTSSG